MNPEKEIKNILNNFLKMKDNLFLSERLFVAASVLNWACYNYKDKEVLNYYLQQVKSHINGEITLYWENGIVKIKRGKK